MKTTLLFLPRKIPQRIPSVPSVCLPMIPSFQDSPAPTSHLSIMFMVTLLKRYPLLEGCAHEGRQSPRMKCFPEVVECMSPSPASYRRGPSTFCGDNLSTPASPGGNTCFFCTPGAELCPGASIPSCSVSQVTSANRCFPSESALV